jgi:hypothetical protein
MLHFYNSSFYTRSLAFLPMRWKYERAELVEVRLNKVYLQYSDTM